MPAVGSSRMTTREPPTKAMATESFRCIPPAGRQGQRWKGGPGQQTPARVPVLPPARTREVPGLLPALMGQPCVLDQLVHLRLHLLLRQPLQAPVEPDVLLHCQAGAGRGEMGGPCLRQPLALLPPRLPCPCLHVEEHVVLGTHPHGFADAVDIGADVPAQDIGSAGGGGQEAGQDGPGWGNQRRKRVREHRTSRARGRGDLFCVGCSESSLVGTQVGTAPGQSQAQLLFRPWPRRSPGQTPSLTWWWSCRPRCGPGRR